VTTPRFKLRQLPLRLRAELLKWLRREPPIDQLNRALADRERFFRAPELDAELLAAVKLITPQFHLRGNEQSRLLWELSQNGSCWGEYDALAPALESLPRPAQVLEIGPGLGRSVVFFKRKLGWETVPFHLYEGDGDKTRYTVMGPRTSASFCGSIAALERVLAHNDVDAWQVHDAARHDYRLDPLPGPFDLIYSFYGVGFHWSIEHFWTELEALMDGDSLGIFTVHHGFEPSERLRDYGCALLPFQRILAKDRPLRMLLVSRNPERLAPAARGSAG
jgi:hypothetical protein